MGSCNTTRIKKTKKSNIKSNSQNNTEVIKSEKIKQYEKVKAITVQPTKISQEIEIMHKKVPFHPHLYRYLEEEEINFYKKLNLIKKCLQTSPDYTNLMNLSQNIDNDFVLIAYKIFRYLVDIVGLNENAQNVYENTDFSKITHCRGADFALVFKILCNNKNIKCKLVVGMVKDFEAHYPHTWNVFEVKESHYFVDVFSAKKTGDIRDCQDFYFSTPPQHFIYSHFPDVCEDILDTNCCIMINREKFIELPFLNCGFFVFGFQLKNYKNLEIDMANEKISSQNKISVKFALKPNLTIKTRLRFKGEVELAENLAMISKRAIDITKETDNLEVYDYVQLNDECLKYPDSFEIYNILLRIPKKGIYYFDVFVKPAESKEFLQCITYYIVANNPLLEEYDHEVLKFPLQRPDFMKYKCEMMNPLHYYFNRKPYYSKTISIKVPNAKSVGIFFNQENEVNHMKKVGDSWEFDLPKEKVYSQASIALSFDDEKYYTMHLWILILVKKV